MPFTDPSKLFTERGISRPELDRLYAAHKVLVEFDQHIANRLRERGESSPFLVIDFVAGAIADLISEPVNTKADWKQTTSPTASRSRA